MAFLAAAGYLAYALGLAAIVDVLFMAVIAVIEKLAGGAMNRRVEY
jgi:hypothetical protein